MLLFFLFFERIFSLCGCGIMALLYFVVPVFINASVIVSFNFVLRRVPQLYYLIAGVIILWSVSSVDTWIVLSRLLFFLFVVMLFLCLWFGWLLVCCWGGYFFVFFV